MKRLASLGMQKQSKNQFCFKSFLTLCHLSLCLSFALSSAAAAWYCCHYSIGTCNHPRVQKDLPGSDIGQYIITNLLWLLLQLALQIL